MTVIKIKEQIKHALDEVPENSLNEVLNFINHLKHKSPISDKDDQYLKKILEEDYNLLKRLAQ